MTMRFFIIDPEGRLERKSVKWYDNITRYGSEQQEPEFAGQCIRIAVVFADTVGRKITAAREISEGCLPFDEEGRYMYDLQNRYLMSAFNDQTPFSPENEFEREYYLKSGTQLTDVERAEIHRLIGAPTH